MMSCVGVPTMSSPSYVMLPCRGGAIPTMLRSVVVFPAPFRPSTVTTSPSSTDSETPWSAWLCP